MHKSLFTILFFFLVFSMSSVATVQEIAIQDVVTPHLQTQETITFTLINNTEQTFLLELPSSFQDLSSPEHYTLEGAMLSVPLSCEQCVLSFSYTLPSLFKEEQDNTLSFYRKLDFSPPELLNYTLALPFSYVLLDNKDIIPAPSSTAIQEAHTFIQWTEEQPSLPAVYSFTLQDHEELETLYQEFSTELGEGNVWLLILLGLLVGVFLGFLLYHYLLKNKKTEAPIPSSLLSQDEQTVLTFLQQNNPAYQKEIGKQLQWSKSKVSAVISNLYHKNIISRERLGRNYKITLAKKIEK